MVNFHVFPFKNIRIGIQIDFKLANTINSYIMANFTNYNNTSNARKSKTSVTTAPELKITIITYLWSRLRAS